MKLLILIIYTIFINTGTAFAGDLKPVICDIASDYYSPIWYGIITIFGAFSIFMAAIDRYALMQLTSIYDPTAKLKFRFNIWLPLLRIFLVIFGIATINQTITSESIIAAIVGIITMMLILYLSWTTKCKLLLNPLDDDITNILNEEEGDDKKDKFSINNLLRQHFMFYTCLYAIVAIIIYLANILFEYYGCIKPYI